MQLFTDRHRGCRSKRAFSLRAARKRTGKLPLAASRATIVGGSRAQAPLHPVPVRSTVLAPALRLPPLPMFPGMRTMVDRSASAQREGAASHSDKRPDTCCVDIEDTRRPAEASSALSDSSPLLQPQTDLLNRGPTVSRSSKWNVLRDPTTRPPRDPTTEATSQLVSLLNAISHDRQHRSRRHAQSRAPDSSVAMAAATQGAGIAAQMLIQRGIGGSDDAEGESLTVRAENAVQEHLARSLARSLSKRPTQRRAARDRAMDRR